jgi:hypothetical protein
VRLQSLEDQLLRIEQDLSESRLESIDFFGGRTKPVQLIIEAMDLAAVETDAVISRTRRLMIIGDARRRVQDMATIRTKFGAHGSDVRRPELIGPTERILSAARTAALGKTLPQIALGLDPSAAGALVMQLPLALDQLEAPFVRETH